MVAFCAFRMKHILTRFVRRKPRRRRARAKGLRGRGRRGRPSSIRRSSGRLRFLLVVLPRNPIHCLAPVSSLTSRWRLQSSPRGAKSQVHICPGPGGPGPGARAPGLGAQARGPRPGASGGGAALGPGPGRARGRGGGGAAGGNNGRYPGSLKNNDLRCDNLGRGRRRSDGRRDG